MSKTIKKILPIIILVPIIIFLINLFLIERPDIYRINFDGVNQTTKDIVLSLLEDKYTEIVFEEDILDKSDLVISNNYISLVNSGVIIEYKPSSIGILPSSIRNLSDFNNGLIGVPLQLDHIELLVANNTYDQIFNNNENISITSFVDKLSPLRSPTFIPLIVAGKDNTSLMDFISLLVLSFGSSEANNNLINSIYQGKSFDEILNLQIGDNIIFEDILQKLVYWKNIKLLHTEWLEFDKETVIKFLENDYAGSAVIRLSKHREYPVYIVKKYTSVQFPTDRDEAYSPDILTIPTFAGINKNSKNIQFSKEIINTLISDENQKVITYASGLAPVHSTVIPMDKQANDLRFWAASSNKIGIAINNVVNEDTILNSFLLNVRKYLIEAK